MNIEALISEFAELHTQLKPLQTRYEELKKILAAQASGIDTLDAVTLSNELYAINYSKPAQSMVCKLSIPEFISVTGSYDSLSISTTAAKKNLTAEQFNKLFEQQQTNSRKLLEVVQFPVK
jgi:hypothetical protein